VKSRGGGGDVAEGKGVLLHQKELRTQGRRGYREKRKNQLRTAPKKDRPGTGPGKSGETEPTCVNGIR